MPVQINAVRVALPCAVAAAAALPWAPAEAQLEEIIVTAQRSEQSLQDVGAAVSVVGSDRLQSARINTLEDLQIAVPSITLGNDFNMAKLFIRGVGANTSTTGSETGVAVHVDGAVIARAEAQLTSLFDLERVEVLRGPQGTLYGRNAVGGSVNLITRKPTPEFEGYGQVTLGDYDQLDIEGAFGGPITDRVLGRFAFKSDTRDGFGVNPVTGNDVDDLNRRMARGHLELLPSETVSLLLTGEYYTQHDASRALKFRAVSYPDVERLRSPGIGGYAVDPRDLASEFDPESFAETWALTETLEWQVGDRFTFRNITNYREYEGFITQDLDISAIVNSQATTGFNTTVQRRDVEADQFSTEFQVNFDTDRVNAVFGLFYFEEDQEPVDTVGLGPLLGQEHILDVMANPAVGAFPPIGPTGLEIDGEFVPEVPIDPAFAHDLCDTFEHIGGGIDRERPLPPKRVCIESDLGTEVWALFGQAVIAVTDNLAVKVGGRYNDETRTSANPSFVVARNGLGPIIITTTEGTSVERSFDDFTPTVGVEWRPGGGGGPLLYVTAAEGFKAGAGENAAGSTIIVDPETVENIEIGYKTTLADDRLALNVAAFTYELEGQQINKTVGGGPAGFSTIFENAAQASADGLEVELLGQITDQLRLFTSVAYLDSQYDDFLTSDPLNPRNVATPGPPGFPDDPTGFNPNEPEIQLAGNPTRNSPKWSANLHVEYDIPGQIGGGGLTFLGDVFYRDDVFFTEFNRLLEGAEAYTMVDLALLYRPADEQFSAELWVKNANDVDRATSTFALSTARTIGVTYLPPRTWGVSLQYDF
ncbi:MAG TPA: TonB-dependent receptor [Gammaproteobacteria bacterium]